MDMGRWFPWRTSSVIVCSTNSTHPSPRPQLGWRTEFGEFQLISYSSDLDPTTHLALVLGRCVETGPCAGPDAFPLRLTGVWCSSSTQLQTAKRLVRESLKPELRKPGVGRWSISTRPGPGLRTPNEGPPDPVTTRRIWDRPRLSTRSESAHRSFPISGCTRSVC